MSPQRIHLYMKTAFIVLPDNSLSLPPMLISEMVTSSYCGLQFTAKDPAIRQQCNHQNQLSLI